MREIALDTETTGLDAENGDRVVEIGCVELVNHVPTRNSFHVYIDPGRAMSADASRITGLTDADLRGKPKFADIAGKFIEFLAGDPLVIHNASFDMRFINAELRRAGLPGYAGKVIDTLALARKRFPGAQASLDALCRRFGIDNSNRVLHGALLDAELLAEVYLEFTGGRQPGLELAAALGGGAGEPGQDAVRTVVRAPRPSTRLSEAEAAAHRAFIETLGAGALWRRTVIYADLDTDD